MSRLLWPLLCVLTGCYDFADLTSGRGDLASADGSLAPFDSGQTADGGPPTKSLTLLAGMPGGAGSADGPLGESRFDGPTGIAFAQGTLYVFDQSASTISTIDANGIVTRVAGTPYHEGDVNGPPGMSLLRAPQMGVAFDGSIYFTDETNDDVRTLAIGTNVVGTAIPSMPGLGLTGITSNATTLYAMATKEPALYEDENDALVAIAGSGLNGSADGQDVSATFYAPVGVAWNQTDSQIYIADSYNGEIRRYDPGSHAVTTVSGVPAATPSTCGVWCQPFGIAAASDGTLYVTDLLENTLSRVTVMDAMTSVKLILAGTRGASGATDGPGGTFNGPAGVAVDGTSVVIADLFNNEVRAFDTTLGTLSTLGGTFAHPGNVEGLGATAMFDAPSGLASAAGTVYVADANNGVIRSVDASGQTALVDNLEDVMTCTGAAAHPVPRSLVVTPDGNTLYFLDASQNAVVALDLATSTTTTLCDGTATLGQLGASAPANFAAPPGMAITASQLYVADTANDRIQVFAYTASPVTVTTLPISGNKIPTGCDQLPGFHAPVGVAIDDTGQTLYVSLPESCGVLGIDVASGNVAVTAGFALGSSDGLATSARFDGPGALTFANGVLYVSDVGNSTLRAMTPAGVVTTYAGTVGQVTNVSGELPARINRPQALAYLSGVGLVLASTPENSLFVIK